MLFLAYYIVFKLGKKDYDNGIDLKFFDLLIVSFFTLMPIANMYFVHVIGKGYINLDFTIIKGKKK